MNKLTLGFSPCPNDCFIFDALIHGKIDTEGLQFEVIMEDVETLNQRAFKGELHISKLSYHAYAYVAANYVLLNSGSALGNNCGPLLITTKARANVLENGYKNADNNSLADIATQLAPQLASFKIGIPGEYTTANFLLNLAFPSAGKKTVMLFSAIEDALLASNIDAGVIIHENRFTYQQKGLYKIMDLGAYWEALTHLPIPLGGIVIKRNFSPALQQKVNRLIRKSVEYAFTYPKSGIAFIKAHAQEMEEEVMYKHIALYVNNYTIDLGTTGRSAVELLFDKATANNIIPAINQSLFIV